MKLSISDNLIRHYLHNACFVNGHSCAGKSTMVKLLAQRFGCEGRRSGLPDTPGVNGYEAGACFLACSWLSICRPRATMGALAAHWP